MLNHCSIFSENLPYRCDVAVLTTLRFNVDGLPCYDEVTISHATKLDVIRSYVSHNDLADLWDNGDKEDHVSPLTTLMLTLCVPC